jgi:hypothetical protein
MRYVLRTNGGAGAGRVVVRMVMVLVRLVVVLSVL